MANGKKKVTEYWWKDLPSTTTQPTSPSDADAMDQYKKIEGITF